MGFGPSYFQNKEFSKFHPSKHMTYGVESSAEIQNFWKEREHLRENMLILFLSWWQGSKYQVLYEVTFRKST